MKAHFLVAVLTCVAGVAMAQMAPPWGMPSEIITQATKCQSCHEAGVSGAPRLNGQRPDYILSRLQAFHDPASQTPHATYFMWDAASEIGAAKAAMVADYFGRLDAPAASGTGPLADEGRKIYQTACQSCHGARGEGGDAGPAPRLAGQSMAYLRAQIAAFDLGVRVHPGMMAKAEKLTPHQIDALAAFLGT